MNSGERERERERESESVRGRSTSRRSRSRISAVREREKHQSAPFASTSAVDRDLAFAPITIGAVLARSRSTLREIAIDGAVVMGLSGAARSRASSVNLGFVWGGDGFVFSL